MDASLEVKPLQVTSVKQACGRFLEGKILSGEWQIGTRLPSERKLAGMLQVSRLMLHEALVELAAKGLVEIVPRRGIYVSDFLQNGSCDLFYTLMAYQNGELAPDFLKSLVEMRMLIESETAYLAAIHRQEAHLANLRSIINQEELQQRNDYRTLTNLDFSFHQQVALASGNLVYPMIINSFRTVYTNLTGRFFHAYFHQHVVDEVFAFHRDLCRHIAAMDGQAARQTMRTMLTHGVEYLMMADSS